MQWRTTVITKMLANILRWLVFRQVTVAIKNFELRNIYWCPCPKGSSIPTSAFWAMTIEYRPQFTWYFVFHFFAKTHSRYISQHALLMHNVLLKGRQKWRIFYVKIEHSDSHKKADAFNCPLQQLVISEVPLWILTVPITLSKRPLTDQPTRNGFPAFEKPTLNKQAE